MSNTNLDQKVGLLRHHVDELQRQAQGVSLANSRVAKVEADLVQQIGALRYHVDELKRQSQGTTLANRRVAEVETALNRLVKRVDDLSMSASSVQVEALSKDLAELTATVQGHYRDLQGQIAQLGDEVTEAVVQSKDAVAQVADVSRRIDSVESSRAQQIDFDRSTATTSGNMEIQPDSMWTEGVILGLIAACLTAFMLNAWIAPDWVAAKDWWFSAIVGVAVLFIASSFGKLKATAVELTTRFNWVEKPKSQLVIPGESPRFADDPPREVQASQPVPVALTPTPPAEPTQVFPDGVLPKS